MDRGFDILLSYQEDLPDSVLDEVNAHVCTSFARVKYQRRPVEVFAGLDFLLPTAVVLFVASSFAKGFFQEAGKETYKSLKEFAKPFLVQIAGKRLFKSMSDQKSKVISNDLRSRGFSIKFEYVEGETATFLFPDGKTEKLYDEALEAIPSVLPRLAQLSCDRPNIYAKHFDLFLEYQDTWVVIDIKSEISKLARS